MNRLNKLKEGLNNLLGARRVYRDRDEWGEIQVFDQRSLRILTFGSVFEQSCMDRRDPAVLVHDYTKAMMLVMAFIDPDAVTVLGVGGGSLIRAVAELHPKARIDAVELRPKVVEVAQTWFGIPQSDAIRMLIGSADDYLRDADDDSTDIIFSDMYHAYGMSPLQSDVAFLHHCQRTLTRRGWLVMNIYGGPDMRSPFFLALRNLFDDIFLCPVNSGNHILLASRQSRQSNLYDYLPYLQALEERMNLRLDLLFRRMSRLG